VFYVCTLAFYYAGNSFILASDIPARLVRRFGEDRAFRAYETVLALMFINQGLGVGCVGALDLGARWTLPPTPSIYALGALLFAVGLLVKVWSTAVVGVDVYYYRDMFLGRPVSEFTSSGPYRVLDNPMYGVGQLHAYGYAILNRSIAGVLATLACHCLIYAFYFAVERPFIRRTYLQPVAA
jgi:protein-S-isoprenylcysteine O-methyltransferase Ste14